MAINRKGPITEILAAEYMAGATTVELADKYDMHHTGVNGRLKRAGVIIRPAMRRCAGSERSSEIISSYQNGSSISDVAIQFSAARSSVRRVLLDAGVEMHPPGLRSRTVNIPSDPVALGYLCGLLDGEGNLQLTKGAKSVGCKMAIYSTTPAIMQWLLKHIGGVVRYDTARTVRKGWLPIGIWSVYRAQDVAALLSAMLPHLIVKKAAAKHALDVFRSKFKVQDSPPTITQQIRSAAK